MSRQRDRSPSPDVSGDAHASGDADASGGADDRTPALRVEHDALDGPAGDAEFADPEAVLVSASVDAVFERYEEESPEEVMLADRRADETDVVPAPPGFEAFAAAVADADVPGEDADGPLSVSPRDFDGAAWSTLDLSLEETDEGVRSTRDPSPAPDDADGFEWVGDPAAHDHEVVDVDPSGPMADPSVAAADSGAPAGDDDESGRSARVLSWLRSSLGR